MKKLMAIVCCVGTLVASSTTQAGDKVNVEFAGTAERLDVGDVKKTSVCMLKDLVANRFDLNAKKFDLVKSGVKLRDDKTLYGVNVRNYNKVQVKEVSYSSQC